MLTTILIIIAVLLYLVYRKIDELGRVIREDEALFLDEHDRDQIPMKTKAWLRSIVLNLKTLNKHVEEIDYTLNADHPAGKMSARSRREANLIKLYSQYLVENRSLTKKQADARAAFEFQEFDSEKIISLLNNDIFGNWQRCFGERKVVEKEFFQTGLLESDAKAQVDNLIPHDVFQPVWALFVKDDYLEEGGGTVELGGMITEHEDNYSDFVKNRAIVLKLIKLNIIKRVDAENEDNYWFDRPTFDFLVKDLNKIRTIVYEGDSSHDDDYFEEKFREGKLLRIFSQKV